MSKAIPAQTIHTVARSIYKEASRYGFGPLDIIRLINELMDLASETDEQAGAAEDGPGIALPDLDQVPAELPIEGQRVSIRSFRPEEDLELLRKWLPDRYGRYFVLSWATAQEVAIESLVNASNNHLGIVTLKDGRPIGVMAYLDHSPKQKRAELRKLIGEADARGKGLAEEATRLWIAWGMGALGLEKIYVSTLQTHISNVQLNEDIGFKVEGLLRNEVSIDGERHDVLRMGIWKD